VLVAYDGSDAARRALAHAADLARDGDHVTVVDVMPEPGVSAAIAPPSERIRQERMLEDAPRFLGGRGIQVETVAPIVHAANEILAAADRIGADIIVVADGGNARRLLGSTSSHIVRSARCDVLVVHEDELDGPEIP
jgi:nucleotide-binding universal stress UspA family protein